MDTIKKAILYPIPKIPSILTIINNILKYIFIKKTYNHYNNLGKPYGVIINDNMLKFHNNDIRKQIKKELKINPGVELKK